MRDLRSQGSIRVEKMVGVYTGDRKYRFDEVDVFPVTQFLSSLHRGEIF